MARCERGEAVAGARDESPPGCRVPNPFGASWEKELKGAHLFTAGLEPQGMASYLPQQQCEQHLPQEKHIWLSGTALELLTSPSPGRNTKASCWGQTHSWFWQLQTLLLFQLFLLMGKSPKLMLRFLGTI